MKHVAIVGLGAAGCRAAMLLNQPGIELHLFEARDRVGGRLHTVRAGVGFYEAGGEWIDADNPRVLELCEELGIEIERSDLWPGVVEYAGERCPEDQPWPDCVASLDGADLAADTLCLDLVEPAYENVLSMDLDAQSLSGFLDRVAATPRGRWWLEATIRSDEGDDSARIGLLGWLCGRLKYEERGEGDMSAYRIGGGAQTLCEQMLARVDIKPRMGEALRRVLRDGDQVELVFDDYAGTYDHVILTLPPPAIKELVFEPALHELKEAALDLCGMSRAVKVSLIFNEAALSLPGWPRRMLADKTFQQVWDASRDGSPPVLNCYICGDRADTLRTSVDPVGTVLGELDALCPGLRAQWLSGELHDWVGDPWAQGAFSHLAPEYVLGGMEWMGTADGRIHFAGEHTGTWIGFIEGALESAERVAKEVLDA
ncbi:MAG: FAD-dependent oxidoreductase [Chthonomonas sp.]|nr:FAD-dependent oxidoreductase [Chthonomonas sp.]